MINPGAIEHTFNLILSWPENLQCAALTAAMWAYRDCGEDDAAELAELFIRQDLARVLGPLQD